jgi:hypothetical protein
MCLSNVLRTYSVFDPKIGYTQGMNFIASSLVYHCDEFAAFWLLANLIKQLELNDIYLPSKCIPHYFRHPRTFEASLDYWFLSAQLAPRPLYSFLLK